MSTLEALKAMERPLLQVSQLSDAVQCLADTINHDRQLCAAQHGIGAAIEDAVRQIEQSCVLIKGQA